MYRFDARLTADHEIARRLGAGVGDDIVVELLIHDAAGEHVVGYATTDGYEHMQHTDELLWPPLSSLRERVEAGASGPLHFNTLRQG